MPGLFGSTILDVALGMVFIYLLLSLICSSINELLAGFLKLRARDLRSGIENLLCDPEMANDVLNHPLMKAMGSTRAETALVQAAAGGEAATGLRRFLTWLWRHVKPLLAWLWHPVNRFFAWLWRPVKRVRADFAGSPSYVPARTFANALLDALDPDRPGTVLMDVVEQKTRAWAAGTVPVGNDVKAQIRTLLKPTGQDLTRIDEARTVADLRTAVEKVPDVAENIAAELQRILAPLDALAPGKEKQEIGRALGSILDVSLDPGQGIIGVNDLKNLVGRLTNAADRQQVLEALKDLDTLDAVRRTVGLLPEGDAQKAALKAVEEAQKGLERFRQGIETWYDDAMDRVSGVYRRRVRAWLLAIGFALALVVGADTIQIYRSLSTNPTARAAVVAQAENALGADWCDPTATPTPAPTATPDATPTAVPTAAPAASPTEPAGNGTSQGQSLDCLIEELDETNLGFGYGDRPAFDLGSADFREWVLHKAVGLFLTTVAVALGAPFWFDVLSKISSLRAAGPRPAKAATDQKGEGAQ